MEPPKWPERITLRDTKVYADEGQRIFSNATGYGYEKMEYVRADIAKLCSEELEVGDAVSIGIGGTEGRVTRISGSEYLVFYFNRAMQREEENPFLRDDLVKIKPTHDRQKG